MIIGIRKISARTIVIYSRKPNISLVGWHVNDGKGWRFGTDLWSGNVVHRSCNIVRVKMWAVIPV